MKGRGSRGAEEQRRKISLNSEWLLFKHLEEWENSQGLVGFASYNLSRSLQKYFIQLQDLQSKLKTRPQVILVEAEPIKFITYFFAAIIAEVNLFICDPHWQTQEWEQVFDLVKPDFVLGDGEILGSREQGAGGREMGSREQSIIGIPTGGSSGKIRFAVHTLSSLTASVLGFAEYFAIPKINSCCTLPLYHVSGLMQLWRCFITQGQLAIFTYKSLKQGKLPDIIPENFFLSLVPTQLKFLLETNPDWLAKFSAVLLGGAPAWRSLLEKARDHQIKLCPTYGMTETASGVVYLSSQDFLNQNNSSGQVLPHAKVEIIDHQGKALNSGQIGIIKIQADSLYGGYYPDFNSITSLITDDLGYFDEQDFLYIVGRESQKIITGGKNVFPAEVETAILATGLVKDICVIGLSDDEWGQVVTAVFVSGENFDLNLLQEKMRSQLSRYKHPKNWLEVESLERSDRGKINYAKITQLAQGKIQEQKNN